MAVSWPGRIVLLTLLLTSTLSAQSATIEATPPGTAPAGSTITVKWSGPNGPGDYVTVVRKGADPSAYLDYRQTSVGRAAVNPLSLVLPAEPGSYEIRYVTGNPRRVLATVPYEVTAVAATIEGPASVAPDARFEVAWAGPNNGGDWVTIVAAGAAARAYGSYVDARTGRADDKSGRRVATLRAPGTPGRYELRYVQRGTVVIGTRAIEVTTVPNTLATTTPPISLPSTGPATSGQRVTGSGTAATPDSLPALDVNTQPGATGTIAAPANVTLLTCDQRAASISTTFAARRREVDAAADEMRQSVLEPSDDKFITMWRNAILDQLRVEERKALEELWNVCPSLRPAATASAESQPMPAQTSSAPPSPFRPAPTSKLDCLTAFEDIRQTFATRRAELSALYAELRSTAVDSFALKSAVMWWMNELNALHAEEARAVQAATQECLNSRTGLPR
jgi:hypothetical protein